jgi:CBS domain-containing protein
MTVSIRNVLAYKPYDLELVSPSLPVLEAVKRMNARHVDVLLVSADHELVGLVTEHDVLARVVLGHLDPVATLVGDVMTRELVTIDADATLEEALVVAADRDCRHLPVVDNGTLCGLVSSSDLSGWIVRDQQRTIDDLYDFVTG